MPKRYRVKMLSPEHFIYYPLKWLMNFLGDDKIIDFENNKGHNLVLTKFCYGFRWGEFKVSLDKGSHLIYKNGFILDYIKPVINGYDGKFYILIFGRIYFLSGFELREIK